MGQIVNGVDKVTITLTPEELKDLIEVLESAGNSTARYANSFIEGSLQNRIERGRSGAAWGWSDKLYAGMEPGINTEFKVQ